jgi:hypothetical protein
MGGEVSLNAAARHRRRHRRQSDHTLAGEVDVEKMQALLSKCLRGPSYAVLSDLDDQSPRRVVGYDH